MTAFAQREDARLFNQLLEILRFYERFEIDEASGNALSSQAVRGAVLSGTFVSSSCILGCPGCIVVHSGVL